MAEELAKALAAVKEACKVVSGELAEDPTCDKVTAMTNVTMRKNFSKGEMFDVMKSLHTAVVSITTFLEGMGHMPKDTEVKLSKLESVVMDLESDKDALAQKWKTGSIIIQSNTKAANPLVKAEKNITKEELGAHAAELIMKKTGVEIEEKDLTRLHFVPGGSLKIKFKDLKYGSKFRDVVQAIKKPSPDQKALNLFCNFELTRSRNNLLYEVRKAVRENKIAKYFVDFNGDISILEKLGDEEQMKLTRMSEVAEANFTRKVNGKQPARTFTAKHFREWLLTREA